MIYKTLVLLCSLFLSTSLFACGGGEDGDGPQTCQEGSTQSCTCSSGETGAQSCSGDSWQACTCNGTPLCSSGQTQACLCGDGSTGSQSCSGSSWGSCACESVQKNHGDLCTAPSFDCGTGLSCVVDSPGDQQGICRVPCQDNFSCMDNDQSWDAGDVTCCDIANGTSACFAQGSC